MESYFKFWLATILLISCGPQHSTVTRSLRIAKSVDLTAPHVFIVPHPDDWQLFMGEYAFDAIASSSTQVVIIMMDAGDDGKGDSFWASRETGALASVRSVLGFPLLAGDPSETADTVDFNGKAVSHHLLRNVSVYFVRLPDGSLHGEGFETNQFQSLMKLYEQKIASIDTVDKKNAYTLSDLRTLLSSILKKELASPTGPAFFYIQDPKSERNYSHTDHLVTQFLARDAIAALGSTACKVRAFEDYRIKTKSENLSKAEYAKKMQLFAAYDLVMMQQQKLCNTCDETHFSWLSRSYMREFDCTDE